ncbi:MAG TPA: hypothetical protein VLU46_10505, partial [Thermoanaerobaculia bacterium]|nr:hypothetical protein [Thermoanaerobaculia bacterium]
MLVAVADGRQHCTRQGWRRQRYRSCVRAGLVWPLHDDDANGVEPRGEVVTDHTASGDARFKIVCQLLNVTECVARIGRKIVCETDVQLNAHAARTNGGLRMPQRQRQKQDVVGRRLRRRAGRRTA